MGGLSCFRGPQAYQHTTEHPAKLPSAARSLVHGNGIWSLQPFFAIHVHGCRSITDVCLTQVGRGGMHRECDERAVPAEEDAPPEVLAIGIAAIQHLWQTPISATRVKSIPNCSALVTSLSTRYMTP